MLKFFEESKDDISPFCKEFSTTNEFFQAFITYCPKTFSYDGENGGFDDDGGLEEAPLLNVSEHAEVEEDEQSNSRVISWFEHFTKDLIASSKLGEQEENEEETDRVDPVVFEDSNPKQAKNSKKAKKIKMNSTLLSALTKMKECDKVEDALTFFMLVHALKLWMISHKWDLSHRAERQTP
jgi:hypothetical protein